MHRFEARSVIVVVRSRAGMIAARTRSAGRTAAAVPLVSLEQLLVLGPLVGREDLLGAFDRILERRAPLLVQFLQLLRVVVLDLLVLVLVLRPDQRGDRVLALLAKLAALFVALAAALVGGLGP